MASFKVIFKSLAPEAVAGFGQTSAPALSDWAKSQSRFPHRDVVGMATDRQLEQWCVDQAMRSLGLPDAPIHHNADGKPHLPEQPERHLSIAHHTGPAGCWAAASIGNQPVGIDVERIRDQIVRIAPRFLHPDEVEALAGSVAGMTVVWAAKECMFKAFGPGLDFREDLRVNWPGLDNAIDRGFNGTVQGVAGHYRLERLCGPEVSPEAWLVLGPLTGSGTGA